LPTSTAAVSAFLGLSPARPVDDDAMTAAVAAANDAVAAWRPDLEDPATEGATWPPRADQAATMQAARLYGRRGSVQGVAAFQDTGVSFMPQLDPDLQTMLELGPYQPSVVA
jgi:predicted TIM-barrel fold metal-dependent hydrolase